MRRRGSKAPPALGELSAQSPPDPPLPGLASIASWFGYMPKSRLAQFPLGQAGSNQFGGVPNRA
ncbi:hypothetical protein PCANC_16499 [Puccinia coronata f. sp. avenae]|uniref:Uncharacterized protein n=1 Tax=Puccinia coronata f. sp. avenae TaxID=200324 RepID=A0A2N5SRB1_9BASI|nr:hypothetical protein PCANC_16499 [Puccinia coronata f. sp. avenae]